MVTSCKVDMIQLEAFSILLSKSTNNFVFTNRLFDITSENKFYEQNKRINNLNQKFQKMRSLLISKVLETKNLQEKYN